MKQKYNFKIHNGRVKVYIDDYYAYKDNTSLYGLDIYLMNDKGGATTMEVYFKTKENWLSVLKLLDENM